MRSRRFARILPALALVTLAIPLTAVAGSDKAGAEGRPHSVQVNAQSSDAYLQFHGRLFVRNGKTTAEYRWGGTSCGSRTMTPEMVELLVSTVRDKDDLLITPNYQDGQGTTKCLVGFTIRYKERSKKEKESDGDAPT